MNEWDYMLTERFLGLTVVKEIKQKAEKISFHTQKEAGARTSRDCYSNNSFAFFSTVPYIQFTFLFIHPAMHIHRHSFWCRFRTDLFFFHISFVLYYLFNDFLFGIILPVYDWFTLSNIHKKFSLIFSRSPDFSIFNEIQMSLVDETTWTKKKLS